MKLKWMLAMVALSAPVMAQSQWVEVSPKRTRDFDERRDKGYCVVRLRVDDEVVVHIRRDRLAFETVRGRAAHDEGSECSQPMPTGSALANFRFKGVDGRGQVELMEAPSTGNRWVAKVRIRDTKGGDEGYTFRVDWENLQPGSSGGGFDSGAWGDRQRDERVLRGRDQNSGWGSSGQGSGSGWGSGNQNQGRGWGSGGRSGNWWDGDFEASTAGSGAARMRGYSDLQLSGARIRLRRNGHFDIELSGAESVGFNGDWRRNGDTAVLEIRDGFSGGGATGTGRVTFTGNGEIQRLELDGRNRNTNTPFRVEFSGNGRGLGRR